MTHGSLALCESRIDMQHQDRLGTKLGNDERKSFSYSNEGDIAAQPINLGYHDRALSLRALPSAAWSCGPGIKCIGALVGFLTDESVGRTLRVEAQAGFAVHPGSRRRSLAG